jgi:hypothetical protein
MPRLVTGWIVATVVAPPTAALAQPRPVRAVAGDRESVAVTIYNQDQALVREVRRVELPAGDVELAWEDVTARIRPETVHVKPLEGEALRVVEQNYRYDVLAPATLLAQYVGHDVTLVHVVPGTGERRSQTARLLSIGQTDGGYGYGYGGPSYVNPWECVYEIGGEVTFGGDWRVVVPDAIPAGLVERPTLFWRLDAAGAGARRIETSYLTGGMTWSADYVLGLSADGTRADLTGWVTLSNDSGIAFPRARLQLMAGTVNLVPPPAPPVVQGRVIVTANAITVREPNAPSFVEESLFEYHQYTLQRATDLADREQKQLELLSAARLPVERHYRLYGLPYWLGAEQSGIQENLHPQVWLEFLNAEADGLGIPLPAGTVRVYGTDPTGGGGREFLGEDAIEHTAREERVKLRVGDAFDVVADRRQTGYQLRSTDQVETAWEVRLRNRKRTPVRVELHEPTSGDWTVVDSSVPWTKESSRELRFDVDCPPDREVVVTWRVRVNLY